MKIGLFFGSFNPIHIGHLAIANYIVEFGNIDQIWFVVSPHNPLKAIGNLLDDQQRLLMVDLAIDNDSRFRSCDVEFTLPTPSYTITTLNLLQEKYPNYELIPIIGADNLALFHQWKDSEILARNYSFIVYPRPGVTLHDIEGNFTIINAPLLEVSSTFIRESIATNHDVRHFLPPKVHEYIAKMKLYSK